MKPSETIYVDPTDDDTSCDGGEYYGHPRVFLTLGDDGQAECYYCGCKFVSKELKSTTPVDASS